MSKLRASRGILLGLIVLLISAAGAIVLLGVLEVGVRLIRPQNIRATCLVGESPGIEDPVVGHLNRPGSVVVCRGPEFSYRAEISAEGFRDREDHSRPAPAGTVRVLLLGDSFTYGSGCDYEEIWPVVFERRLRELGRSVDVIKAGVPGFDTRREVLYLRMIFDKYVPDVVLICFVHHDLWTAQALEDETLDESAVHGESPEGLGGRLRALQSVTAFKRLLEQSDQIFLSRFARHYSAPYFSFPFTPEVQRRVTTTEQLFTRADGICESGGSKLMVLYVPQVFQVFARARGYRHGQIDVGAVDRVLGKFADEHGIAWVSVLSLLADDYARTGRLGHFRCDGHLNERGHDLVGRYLAEQFGEMYGGEWGE